MESIKGILQTITTMQWSDYLDILLVVYLVFRVLPLFRTPSTLRVARTVLAVAVVAVLTKMLNLYSLSFILNQFLSIGLLALVVLFQPELRRMMDRLGSSRLWGLFGSVRPATEMDNVIAQTVAACEYMSKNKVGALIVFARKYRLDDRIETGTVIDGRVSEQLIRNIFFHNAALHDGAMIIRDGKIAAAGCVLQPLSTSDRLPADLGTRHRSGVGISEVSDALVVIVSEENGAISVAEGGILKRHLAPQTLEKILKKGLLPQEEETRSLGDYLKRWSADWKKGSLKTKVGAALLSVLCACGLWLYVITTVSPDSTETYYNIPIVWEGESVLTENGLMVTAVSSNTVNLKLSGNRSDLGKLNSGNITIKADLSGIREPGNQVRVNCSSPSFPGEFAANDFSIESMEPYGITATIVRRAEKTVPVEVVWSGKPAAGFMTDRENRVLDVSEVKLKGPESVVNTIAKAVINVDLEGRKESVSESYHYTLCDEAGTPVDAKLIVTDVEEIRLDVAIRRVKELKLLCPVIPGGGANEQNTTVSLSAETIRVSGSEAALDNLGDTLTIGTINLADISRDTTLTFGITLPEGIVNLTGVTEVTAEVKFQGLITKELTVETIHSVNIPEGLDVELITQKLTLIVRGPADEIRAVTPNDVVVTVDFTGAEVGTSTFKASVVFGEKFSRVGTLKIEPVSATIERAG